MGKSGNPKESEWECSGGLWAQEVAKNCPRGIPVLGQPPQYTAPHLTALLLKYDAIATECLGALDQRSPVSFLNSHGSAKVLQVSYQAP